MRGGHQATSNNQLWRRYRINWSASANVKTTSDNTNQRHWTWGSPRHQRGTEPAEQQPATSAFLTKWLNKLTSALEQKRVREFLSLGHWSLPSETNVEKRAYTSIKSDEEWTSRVLPPNRTVVNSLNYEGIAVIELQFYHFPDSDRLRVGSVTD